MMESTNVLIVPLEHFRIKLVPA
eukprot:SAG11_NODE_21311_length_427_cov_3.673780_1_plen_22_part_10